MCSGGVEPNPGPRPDRGSLLVTSYNVRGLNDERKLRHLLNFCMKQNTGKAIDYVTCLQESFIQKSGKIPYLWRGNFYLTPGTGNSCGCLTLLSAHLDIIEKRDIENRAHVIACKRSGETNTAYIIANVYAPNPNSREKISFFEELADTVLEFQENHQCTTTVVLGDFNLIFKSHEAKNRNFSAQEKKVSKTVLELLASIGLKDIWEDRRGFTWRRPNSDTFSTIDRMFFSKTNLEMTKLTDHWSLSSSDHAAIEVHFKLVGKEPGIRSRITRLDPTLLKHPPTKEKILSEIQSLLGDAPTHWDPHMRLEYLKMCIRTVMERAQADRKKKERTEEEDINNEIEVCVKSLSNDMATVRDGGLIDHIEELRTRKAIIIEEKGERLAQKLGTKWYNEGEKSTKYFLRLLNRNMPDDFKRIETPLGQTIEDPILIEQEIVNFYKKLYEEGDRIITTENNMNEFFANINRISGEGEDEIVKPVTAEELLSTLGTCQDSSPGPDGISYSIIGELWTIFGPILVDAWRYSLVKGELPVSHRMSYLKLIPKAGKDLTKLTNWRPITLSNCDHKLISKLYAKRMSEKLASEIRERQTAYLKGRLINDNIRAMLACINLSNLEENFKGILVSLDAKKAFDSVDHSYIEECLKRFGCPKFIPIFRILYSNLRTDILINGKIVPGFLIKRGVKQGDSLSCILFIMCMEPLLRNIESNPRIESLYSETLNCQMPKAYAYADDVSCTVANSVHSLQEIFIEYERLTKVSGLELNADKTEILKFGSGVGPETIFSINYCGIRHRIETKNKIKINGIYFQPDPRQLKQTNVDAVAERMDSIFKKWARRGLSTLGKILITKTFAISQIIFLMQSIKLDDKDFKIFNSLLYKYIWNRQYLVPKAPERVKRSIVNTPIKEGGFGMLDIAELDKSLKLKAVGRILDSKHPFISIVKNKLDLENFFEPVLNTGVETLAYQAIALLKEERLKIWSSSELNRDRELMAIIRNTKIRSLLNERGKASVLFFRLWAGGARKVSDLTQQALDSIKIFIDPIKHYKLDLAVGVNVNQVQEGSLKSLIVNGRFKLLSKCTSKEIRLSCFGKSPILNFKIGLVLEPKESCTWFLRISKLTSTKHKNTLLRLIHGEFYTKEKLHRFGLIDNNTCPRCDQIETLNHKFFNCDYTSRIWENFSRKALSLTTDPRTPIDGIKKLLGIFKEANTSYISLAAEILLRISYLDDNQTYLILPKKIVEHSIKSIASRERNRQIKEELYSLLDTE